MSLINIQLALRVLYRQRFYTAINILGFALGIAVFLFISLFILDQRSYDRWHEHSRQVYRLEKGDWALLGTAYGPFMARNIPETQAMARILTLHIHQAFGYEDKLFTFHDVIFADSTVFDIFSFHFLAGDPQQALTSPASVVITESMANTIFNRTDVVGQVLRYDDEHDMLVTGVIRDVKHSHIRVNAILPFHLLTSIYQQTSLDHWGGWNYMTYVRLQPGTDVPLLEKKLNDVFVQEMLARFGQEPDRDFFLRPLRDIYFADDVKHVGATASGQRQTVQLFLAVALFILLIAVVNFINLSTARSALRAREVGIRRLMGSHRRSLVLQFLTESVLITALAVVLALVVMETAMPWFRSFAGISLSLGDLGAGFLVLVMLAGTLAIGLLSGIYPSMYLTAVAPVQALKGSTLKGRRGAFFRKVLIVFQFVISLVLITATLVISNQLRYMKSRDLGITLDHKVLIRLEQNTHQRWDAFRTALKEHPGIINIGRSAQVPGYITWQESAMGNSPESKQFTFMQVNAEFLPMMGVEVVAGRLFSRDYPSEHMHGVILNEQALRYFEYRGSPEDAIGQPFRSNLFDHELHIVGVAKDFHYNSLQNPIAPLVILWNDHGSYNVTVEIDPARYQQAVTHMEKVWMEFAPGTPFVIHSIGGLFMEFYQDEDQLQHIFAIFSGLAVFIACLGLLGLSSFMAERRQAEMAVRKVLGAGMFNLAGLLFKDFLILLGLALLIATPLSWVLLTRWLQEFPYHISVGIAPFAIAASITLAITMLTVSWHAVKVALVAPGQALKYE
jgi:putative ABC transport system permease protein